MKPVKKSTSNHFKGNWQMQANLESDCCSGCTRVLLYYIFKDC